MLFATGYIWRKDRRGERCGGVGELSQTMRKDGVVRRL